MKWKVAKFDSLSTINLYEILQIRAEIFVVEQDCPYQDIDNKDIHPETRHLISKNGENKIIAYARLIAPNVSFDNASSIGRVLVKVSHRKNAAGYNLMQRAIEETLRIWPDHDIKIGAQFHLVKFYEKLGFSIVSEMYLEDGIEHVDMLYSFKKNRRCLPC